jgi:hypothetical protein
MTGITPRAGCTRGVMVGEPARSRRGPGVRIELMVNANRVAAGDHTMFLCANDAEAKARVRELLIGNFGWRDVIDLGEANSPSRFGRVAK